MHERFALPGFQAPAAPKEKERVFADLNEPFEVVFLAGVPKDQPLRSFEFFISQAAGSEFVNLLAYSRTNAFVVVRDNPESGKDYLVRLLPDELSILPGVYAFRVTENGSGIFETLVNVRNHPAPCPAPQQGFTS